MGHICLLQGINKQISHFAVFSFGSALLLGEGEAMAKYVAEGKRTPRHGEIGFTSTRASHLKTRDMS